MFSSNDFTTIQANMLAVVYGVAVLALANMLEEWRWIFWRRKWFFIPEVVLEMEAEMVVVVVVVYLTASKYYFAKKHGNGHY